MDDLITQLYEHNRWANLTLLDSCQDLEEEQFRTVNTTGFYGSIQETFLHLASAEARYVWRLKGSAPPPPKAEKEGWPGIEELRRRLDVSGRELADVVRTTPDDLELHTKFGAKEFRFVAGLVKIQAINHATEHRAQISAMLTQLGHTPPEIDGWTFGLHSGVMRSDSS